MEPAKVACSLLVLGLVHFIAGQEESNSTICRIPAYHAGDGVWRQASNSTKLPPWKDIRNYRACCGGYVYKDTPECDPECPSGSCVSGYCPPDDESVNCKCYDDDTYPAEDDDCIPVCNSGQDSDCNCHSGYTKDLRTNICVPTECFNRCSNGKCDQLGACTCDESFTNHSGRSGLCVPTICADFCEHGTCNSNGTCVCDEGYKSVEGIACTKITCPSSHVADASYCRLECISKCFL